MRIFLLFIVKRRFQIWIFGAHSVSECPYCNTLPLQGSLSHRTWNLTITAAYLLTYLLPDSLTPCSRVLLEKLTGSQLVKKFLVFYGTRRFITAFAIPRHLSLSWARSIQSMPRSHFVKFHLNIIVPSTPGSSKWFFPPVSPAKPCMHLSLPHSATWSAHLILLDLIIRIIFPVLLLWASYLVPTTGVLISP